MDVASIGLIEDQDILLDLASLALSHLDHQQTDIAPYLEKLEEIEDRVCREGRSALLARERAAVLSRVLNGEFGFVGDTETYDAPVNADFIRLLDRKRGLPIALSILYVAMARRAGWSAYVLNLPGHVLVQIGDKSPAVIDPFASGNLVSLKSIAAICRACLGEEGGASALSVTRLSNRGVLIRLLNNQAIRAANENKPFEPWSSIGGSPRLRRKCLMHGKNSRGYNWRSMMLPLLGKACSRCRKWHPIRMRAIES